MPPKCGAALWGGSVRLPVKPAPGLFSPEFLAHVPEQFVRDGLIVPAAGTDKQLQRPAFFAGLRRDRFGGLTLQAGQFAAQHGAGVLALFVAVEAGQVADEEGFEAGGTRLHGSGRDLGIVEQGLRIGMVENVHNTLRYKGYR